MAPFVAKHAVTWPFVLDPERTAYAKYAEAFIPRNHRVEQAIAAVLLKTSATLEKEITAIDKM